MAEINHYFNNAYSTIKEVSNLKMLALDTSGEVSSVSLLNKLAIATVHKALPQQQSKEILLIINGLLRDQSLSLQDLDVICVAVGPGSFTGTRIATAVAQGIGYALKKPIIALSSLSVIAETVYLLYGYSNILVAVDAHMQQIYWGVYQAISSYVQLIQAETLIFPKNILPVPYREACGVGNAWSTYKADIEGALEYLHIEEIFPTNMARADAMLYLGVPYFLQGKFLMPEEVSPIYLR